MKSIRWPKYLNPTHVAHLLRFQRNSITALQIFNEAKTRYPTPHNHNGPLYATIISILASSNHLTQMKHVIKQMKADSCECKDSIFATAIRAFAHVNRLDDAIELFYSIPQFNCVNWTDSFNTLLQFLLSEGKLQDAYNVYVESSNKWEVKTNVRSFNLLIAALCRMNRSDLALQVFVEMNEQCCYPDRDTYQVLMKGLCDDGRFDDAIHLLYSMFWRVSQKGCGADVAIYRILLEALCDKGKFEEAERILGKVLRKGLKASKRRCKVPDLAVEFRSHQSLDGIKGLINDALVRGGVVSFASYSAVIFDLYLEGKIDDANRLFNEMCEKGFRPSVSLYEAKIAALCGKGRAGDAVKVVEEEMVEGNCVPRVRTYNTVIGGLCKAGMSTRAVGYLERMDRQVGCVPDKVTFESLVDGLCCEGRFVEASRVTERMVDRRYWPCKDTFDRLISGLCVVHRRYEAVLWLEEMVGQGKMPEAFVWNCLVAMVCCDEECPVLLWQLILEGD